MASKFEQSQRQEQKLLLTPQLKRSLEILQAPSIELREIIDDELKVNPLLEEVSIDIERPKTIGENLNEDFDDFDDNSEYQENSNFDAEQKNRDFLLNSIPDHSSLQEYLLNEAALDAKNESVAKAFKSLAGSLDERGFLSADAVENALALGVDKKSIDEALQLLRECEPAGIGAFDMRESLMLQLERNARSGSLAYRILENHYQLLMKRKVEEIADLENRNPSEVEAAIAEIAKLNTSPATDFEPQEEKFISPDIIFFQTQDGDWSAELARDNLPRLQINQDYRMMAASGKMKSDELAYFKEKIRDGKWFMEAIETRRKTLEKIALAIIAKQPDFFENGVDALRPMIMRDIADMIGVHPTTVGRAISEKYAQTPFGLYPLKIFFSGGYESDESEKGISSESVKNRIAKIVEDESPQAPLSDSKISDILANEGVKVARRTISKYREELGIAPKNLRKRF